MGMIERTCDAILRGDAAKSAGEPWHGQQFVDVAKATCEDDDMPMVNVTMKDGRTGCAGVQAALVHKPKDRAMAVADIEDAVRHAIIEARLDALAKPFDVASSQTPIPETAPEVESS